MAHVYAVVSSLVNNCLETISINVSLHEDCFDSLPRHLKDRLLKKLSLRGLLHDKHLEKVHGKVFFYNFKFDFVSSSRVGLLLLVIFLV